MNRVLALVVISGIFLAGCATPLRTAVERGDVNTVRDLLDKGANAREMDFNYGTPAIAFAANVDVARLLVERGAVVDEFSNPDFAPLVKAASEHRDAVAIYLIEQGANIEVALSKCKERYDMLSSRTFNPIAKDLARGFKHCIDLLTEIKADIKAERAEAKRQEQELEKAKAIEAAKAKELKAIVEALRASDQAPKAEAKPAAVRTEISGPAFGPDDILMTDNDLAVIIGIEGYQGLPKSDYSYDDATLVKEYAKALGFKERNIELLTDERATKTSIEKTIEAWLANKSRPGSRVFVYYSGHGAPDPATGDAYIVPYDGDPNYIGITGYPLKRLYASLGKLPASEVVVVLDACFSGAGGRSVIAKGTRPMMLTMKDEPIAANMAVLSSTQGAQISTSSPDKGHGVFTFYFLKALKEGKATVAEIYEYAKPLVEDEAKQMNVQQSPDMMGVAQGKFALRK